MKTIIMLILLIAAPARACLWINGTTLDGKKHRVSGISPVHELQAAIEATPQKRLKRMVRASDGMTDEEQAVKLILEGDYGEAIKSLREMENQKPGQYSVAANLGTAFELSGDDASALKWISTALERDPKSHMGTEWLHKLILQTKIRIKNDPEFLKTNHVIQLDVNRIREPKYRWRYEDQDLSMKEVMFALNYQLTERLVFVKPKDAIVADLLYSYAVLEANIEIIEPAIDILNMAKDYSPGDTSTIDAFIQECQKALKKKRFWPW